MRIPLINFCYWEKYLIFFFFLILIKQNINTVFSMDCNEDFIVIKL